jgi:hypothetical protein
VVLAPKLVIAHARGVLLEVNGLDSDGVGNRGRGGVDRSKEPDQPRDLPTVEFGLVAQNPSLQTRDVAEVPAAHTRRQICLLDVQSDIGGKPSAMSLLAEIQGAKELAPPLLPARAGTASSGNALADRGGTESPAGPDRAVRIAVTGPARQPRLDA